MNKLQSIALGVAGISFFLGVTVGNLRWDDSNVPSCYEDEVIIWTGNAHDTCWPIDDFWMLEEIQ